MSTSLKGGWEEAGAAYLDFNSQPFFLNYLKGTKSKAVHAFHVSHPQQVSSDHIVWEIRVAAEFVEFEL